MSINPQAELYNTAAAHSKPNYIERVLFTAGIP